MLERVWRKGTLLPCWWECKLVQPLWRTVWRFLKKLEIELPYDPAIPLLGIHTDETRIERDTCTPMFIAALFTIARTWKPPRCLSAYEWIRKLWYIYTWNITQLLKRMHLSQFKWDRCNWSLLYRVKYVRKKNTNTVYYMEFIEFRKMVMMILYARQEKRHRCKEQSSGLCRRRRGWDDLRE